MWERSLFEFVEGSSSKFWEIWVEGTAVFTRHGKIGSAGRVTTREEGSEDRAHQRYKKLVHAKLSKGYVEKTPAR